VVARFVVNPHPVVEDGEEVGMGKCIVDAAVALDRGLRKEVNEKAI
jgi:hypothetical protein